MMTAARRSGYPWTLDTPTDATRIRSYRKMSLSTPARQMTRPQGSHRCIVSLCRWQRLTTRTVDSDHQRGHQEVARCDKFLKIRFMSDSSCSHMLSLPWQRCCQSLAVEAGHADPAGHGEGGVQCDQAVGGAQPLLGGAEVRMMARLVTVLRSEIWQQILGWQEPSVMRGNIVFFFFS